MKAYKENTYLFKDGKKPDRDKTPIGVFRHDETAEEYIERIDRKLKEQGIIERG